MDLWVEVPVFKLPDKTEELNEGLFEKVDEPSFVLGGSRVGVPPISFVESRGVSGRSKFESRESGNVSFVGGTRLTLVAMPEDGPDNPFVSFVLEEGEAWTEEVPKDENLSAKDDAVPFTGGRKVNFPPV